MPKKIIIKEMKCEKHDWVVVVNSSVSYSRCKKCGELTLAAKGREEQKPKNK